MMATIAKAFGSIGNRTNNFVLASKDATVEDFYVARAVANGDEGPPGYEADGFVIAHADATVEDFHDARVAANERDERIGRLCLYTVAVMALSGLAYLVGYGVGRVNARLEGDQ